MGVPFCINKKHGRKDRKLPPLNTKGSNWPAGARHDALLYQQLGQNPSIIGHSTDARPRTSLLEAIMSQGHTGGWTHGTDEQWSIKQHTQQAHVQLNSMFNHLTTDSSIVV